MADPHDSRPTKALALRGDADRSSATRRGSVPWIKQLSALGLVRRDRNPADRRRTVVRLTAVGQTDAIGKAGVRSGLRVAHRRRRRGSRRGALANATGTSPRAVRQALGRHAWLSVPAGPSGQRGRRKDETDASSGPFAMFHALRQLWPEANAS
ncbi:MarR family winged helix-turn-helix transcriptional regulator [Xanthomonas cerealis pv. cerealis]|nr:MarR family winged helix-turn-helix transcriptional regulator [Xanthomonas translucens pv. pistacia]